MKKIFSQFSKKIHAQFQNPQNLAALVSILMLFTLSIQIKMIITGLLFTELKDPKLYREFWGSILTQISSLMSSLIVWITLGINVRNSTESNYRSGVSYIKDLIAKIEELSKTIFTGTSQPFVDFTTMFYYLLGDTDKFVKRRNINPQLFESFVEARFHDIHLFENLMSQIESILSCDAEKHHGTTVLEETKISGGIYLSNYGSSIESSMPKEFIFSILILSLLNRYDLHTYDSKAPDLSWKEITLQLLCEKKDSWKENAWSNISRIERNFIDIICPFLSIELALTNHSLIHQNPLVILEHMEKILMEDDALQSTHTLSFYEIPINMMYNVASKVSILRKFVFEHAFSSPYKNFLLRLAHSCLLRYTEVLGPEMLKNSIFCDTKQLPHAVVFFILKDLISLEPHTNFGKKQFQVPWEEFMFLKDIGISVEEENLILSYTTCYKEYVWNPTTSKILSKFPTLKSFITGRHHLLKKNHLFPYTKRTSSPPK